MKQIKPIKLIIFILCISVVFVCSVVPAFADWGNITDIGSYLAYNWVPLDATYKMSNRSTYDYTLVDTQDDLLDIRAVSYEDAKLSAQVNYENIDAYFYTAQTFQRNDSGQVKGNILRTLSASDNDIVFQGVHCSSPLGLKTSIRGASMISLQRSQQWRLLRTEVVYRCNTYNINTRQLVNVETRLNYSQTDYTTYLFPVQFMSDVIDAAGIRGTGIEDVLIFDYDCELYWGKPAGTDAGYYINYPYSTLQLYNPSIDNPFQVYSKNYVYYALEDRTSQGSFDFLAWLDTAFGFLDVQLFGNFSIGGLLSVVLSIGLIVVFLRLFAGG